MMPGRAHVYLAACGYRQDELRQVHLLLGSGLDSLERGAGLSGYGAGRAAGNDAWGSLQAQFDKYNMIFYVVLALAVIAFVAWGVWRWRRHKNAAAKQAEGAED